MKVDELIEFLDAVRPFLERYRGRSLADLAGVLLSTGQEAPGNEGTVPEVKPGPGDGGKKKPTREKASRRGKPEAFDRAAVLSALESMDTGDMPDYLKSFTKDKLLEIAAALNLKGLKKKRVDELITSLVRYYEDRRLPERILGRLPADDEAFMEEMRKKYGF